MYYDPLALYRTAGDGCDCEKPPMGEDDDNQNGGGENNGNEPSIPNPLPPVDPLPPNDDNDTSDEIPPENDGTGGDSENLPADAIDPRLLSLAMGFVPYQCWETPYAVDVGLSRGTIFPSLDKPFLGEPPISNTPTLRWGR